MRPNFSLSDALSQGNPPSVSYKPFRETIYEYVRQQIISGSLQEGTLFSDGEIADFFGTSRTPVREAVQKLEAEGLVERIPMKGNIIKGISITEVAQMYAVRLALETMAMRLAAPVITLEELKRLRSCLEQAGRVLEEDGKGADLIEKLGPISLVFNKTLLESCRMPRLLDEIWQQREKLTRFKLLQSVLAAAPDLRFATRKRTYEALARRDPDEAAMAWAEHIRTSLQLWLDINHIPRTDPLASRVLALFGGS